MLEVPELADDSRFLTNPLRSANHDALIPLVEARTKALTTSRLLELTREHEVPCSGIQDIGEVVADPQVAANEMLVSAPHPEVDDYRDVALPMRMGGRRPHADRPPPLTGEHTLEVLQELGFSKKDVADMIEQGVAEAPEGTP